MPPCVIAITGGTSEINVLIIRNKCSDHQSTTQAQQLRFILTWNRVLMFLTSLKGLLILRIMWHYDELTFICPHIFPCKCCMSVRIAHLVFWNMSWISRPHHVHTEYKCHISFTKLIIHLWLFFIFYNCTLKEFLLII